MFIEIRETVDDWRDWDDDNSYLRIAIQFVTFYSFDLGDYVFYFIFLFVLNLFLYFVESLIFAQHKKKPKNISVV